MYIKDKVSLIENSYDESFASISRTNDEIQRHLSSLIYDMSLTDTSFDEEREWMN